MTLPPGVAECGELRIDHSTYSNILKCFRYAWHSACLQRVPSGWQRNLGFGTAVHAALHERQVGLMKGEGAAATSLAMSATIDKAFAGAVLAEDEYLHAGRAKDCCELYQLEYASDIENFEIVASERSGERELGVAWMQGPRPDHVFSYGEKVAGLTPVKVIWQGKTDGIWRDRRTGKNAPKDTKTTGELGDAEKKRDEFRLSRQLMMYCWLFEPEFGEMREAVVDLIVVRKPVGRVTAATKPRTEFYRYILDYTTAQIEEAKCEILQMIGFWLTACASPSAPPPMTGAPLECVWGSGCAYLAVCKNRTESERMMWLNSGAFQANTFNPMAT